jgi:acetylornithine deacetylase/succinyl-diaminopimelate desuccinylase family protein
MDKIKQKVLECCDNLTEETIKLLAELVKIPSENPSYNYDELYYKNMGYTEKYYDEPVTRGGETRVAKYLRPILEEICGQAELVAKDLLRSNVVGISKNDRSGKSLALNAHIDTVATGFHDKWTETDGNPFNPVIKNGRMYGRGTTDDKGPLSAMIMAVKALKTAGVKLHGELQIHCTVGEESGDGKTLGPGWFLNDYPQYKTDACIVAESSAPPARLGVCLASAGITCLKIHIQGKAVHSSMRYRTIRAGYEGSDVGVNAMDIAFKIYRALQELEQQWASKKDETGLAPIGFSSIPIGVDGGHPGGLGPPSFLADSIVLSSGVWRMPKEKAEDVKEDITRAVNGVCEGDYWLREHPPVLEWWEDWEAFYIEKDHPLSKTVSNSVREVLREEPEYMCWQPTTDARWYQDAGVPSLIIGPGDYRNAQAYNEYITLSEFSDAMKIYAFSVMDWLGYE